MNNKYLSIIISVLIGTSVLSPKSAIAGQEEDYTVNMVSISAVAITLFIGSIFIYFSEKIRLAERGQPSRRFIERTEVFTGAFTPTRVHFNDMPNIIEIPRRQNPYPSATTEHTLAYQQLFNDISNRNNIRERIFILQEYFYNQQRVFFDRDTLEPLATTHSLKIFLARIHSLPNFNSWSIRGLDQNQLPLREIVQFYIYLLNPPRHNPDFLLAQLTNIRDRMMFERMIAHLQGQILDNQDREALETFCTNVLLIPLPKPWPKDPQ